MAQSFIEWTEMTWNPTTGCDKVSASCKYCYAEVMTRHLHAMGIEEWWVWDIKQQCQEQEVAFYFKQWGGVNKKKAGRMLAGSTYNEMPYKDLLSLSPDF